MSRRVLFLCTGNYYRSRFAEAVFNHHTEGGTNGWTAFSRGLAIHMAEGDLAKECIEGLAARSIHRGHTAPGRQRLCREDLDEADVVVALHEPEHRPMLIEQFPDCLDRVIFWRIPDVNELHHSAALWDIESRVIELLATLPDSQE
jgi:protein-tyrosine phosphatase